MKKEPDDIIPEKMVNVDNKNNKKLYNKKWINRILSIALFFIFTITIGFSLLVFLYGRDLPDYTVLKEYEPPVSSRVYSADGSLMTQYSRQRRVFMPIESIPKKIQQAFIATEDKNFYSHAGVDGIALSRAIVDNVMRIMQNKRIIGASTITQQVTRQFFLTNERTITRKIKEAILALRIERVLSKKRILELYLNQIYLGRGAYGIGAASIRYFNLPPSKLNYAQIAYLAALPKAPNNYHPIRKTKRAIIRRNWVLTRMFEEGYISKEDLEKNKKLPLDAMKGKDLKTIESDYFLEEARRTVYKKFGDKDLYGGGLSIHTTLNSDYQKIATQALKAGIKKYGRRHGYRGSIINLSKYKVNQQIEIFKKIQVIAGSQENWKQALVLTIGNDSATLILKNDKKIKLGFASVKWARKYYTKRAGNKPKVMSDVLNVGDVILLEKNKNKYELTQVPLINGAIVVMDPHTGRVLAMSGGWDFETSKFNRATQAKRQTGSAIKPFVYLTALENGKTPATMLLDAPFVLTLENGEKWKPRNFSKKFYGYSLMRTGLEKSRNLMTVRLAQSVDMEKVAKTFDDFNIMDNPPSYLSFALGAGESTLLRMTTAYSMLVNGGKYIEPSLIDRIQNRYGKIVFRHNKQKCDNCSVISESMPIIQDNRKQVANPIASYQIITMLEGVVKNGSGRELKKLNMPIAGKTGTTNDNKDSWFIAVTPDLVVGAYLGFDNPTKLGFQPPTKKYNWWRQETGASVAVPTIKEFFIRAKSILPKIPFRIPEGVRFVKIDKQTGLKADSNSKYIQTEAFAPGTEPTTRNKKLKDQSTIGLDDVY